MVAVCALVSKPVERVESLPSRLFASAAKML